MTGNLRGKSERDDPASAIASVSLTAKYKLIEPSPNNTGHCWGYERHRIHSETYERRRINRTMKGTEYTLQGYDIRNTEYTGP